MVEYVTRDELIGLGRERLSEQLAKVAKAETRSATGSTFLSHSSKDDEVIPGVVRILESHGARVYLDKKDPTLGGQAPQAIATSLRKTVSVCRKFVLFANRHIKDSKWVPWELGLADGYRTPSNVCIFPAPDKTDDFAWTEQEYLGIYDRVVWGTFKTKDDPEWMVWNYKSNVGIKLREWLSR